MISAKRIVFNISKPLTQFDIYDLMEKIMDSNLEEHLKDNLTLDIVDNILGELVDSGCLLYDNISGLYTQIL